MKRADMIRIGRRLVLMIGGEAMQSGFHFALNLALLPMLSARDYGIFSIVMVTGGLSLTYVRSLTAMPASIWIGRSRTRYAAGIMEVTFGSAAVLLSLLTAGLVGLLMHVWVGDGAVAVGCFIGLWSLRGHLRTAFFALGRSGIVSLSDLAFTLSGAVAASVALWAGGDLLQDVLLALAVANGVGIATMLVLARRPVRLSLRLGARRRYGRLWRQLGWSFVSMTMTNLQGQGIALLVAAIDGPAAFAPIAAVLLLFVPLRVAASAFVNMLQPEIAALMARGEHATVWRHSKMWSAIMGIGGIAYGATMLLMLPFLKSQALQNTPIQLIGVFAWAIYSITMLYVMPRIVLEVLTAFRTVALITAAGAIVGLTTIRLILEVAPPAWSLAGGAASELVVLVASWAIVRRKLAAMAGAADRRPFGGGLRTLVPASPSRLRMSHDQDAP